MRALVVRIGLALVLATALWWVVDRRLKPLVPPMDAAVASESQGERPLQDIAASDGASVATASVPDVIDEPASAREPLDAGARIIRGRLLDAHCGQPIGSGVRLELSSRIGSVTDVVAPTDDGRFATTQAFSRGRVRLRILEARSGEELFDSALAFDPREPVWTVRADIGLVIPLELGVPADVRLNEDVRARVVEEGDGGHEWIWLPLRGGEHPFVFYRSLARRLGGSAHVEVEIDPRGEPGAKGRAPLRTTHGLHAPLRLELVEETHAFGRIVDEQGEPVPGAQLWLLPTAAEKPLDEKELWRCACHSAKDGAFHLFDLHPGPQLLRQSDPLETCVTSRIVLAQGPNDLGTIVLPKVDPSFLTGTIRDPSGAIPDEPLTITIRDVHTGRRRHERVQSGEGERGFLVALPHGTYEVRPSGPSGMQFQPASLTVTAGEEHVVFEVTRSEPEKLVLRAVDETSGSALESFHVAYRDQWRWLGGDVKAGESLPSAAESYVVWANGYRASIVPAAAFTARANGVRVGEVRLARGSSEVLVFVDPGDESSMLDGNLAALRASPLAGVRVLSGGRTVATSDEDGLALAPLDAAEELTFELEGCRTLGFEVDSGLRFVWMIRE
jgi:hypothetical protein